MSDNTPTPDASAADDPQPIGNCQRMIDVDKELVCDRPGYEEIVVRNPFGRYVVVLCEPCRAEHRAFYVRLRGKRNRGHYQNGQRMPNQTED